MRQNLSLIPAHVTGNAQLADMRSSINGKRILVVEHDDRLYCALKQALQEAGCEVFGSWAEEVLLPYAAPASYLDAALIHDNGVSPIRELVQRLHQTGIPVVILGAPTARDTTDDFASASLSQPFTEEDLIRVLAETIDRAEAQVDIVARPVALLRSPAASV